MKKNIFLAALAAAALTMGFTACNNNEPETPTTGGGPNPDDIYARSGVAPVRKSAGRTECGWVRLWEDGPMWAEFNVGATIVDYADLSYIPEWAYEYDSPYTITEDDTPFLYSIPGQENYNTRTVGGLYAIEHSSWNGRQYRWDPYFEKSYEDAAWELWGPVWVTPSVGALDTLSGWNARKHGAKAYTKWTWCDGVNTQYVPGCPLMGYKVSGVDDYADASIFLPVTGNYEASDYLISVPDQGAYAGTIEKGRYINMGDCLNFRPDDIESVQVFGVYDGLAVRPVIFERGYRDYLLHPDEVQKQFE